MSNPFLSKYLIKVGESINIKIKHDRPIYKITKAEISSGSTKLDSQVFQIIITESNSTSEQTISNNHINCISSKQNVLNQFENKYIETSNAEFFQIHFIGREKGELEITIENVSVEVNVSSIFESFKEHLLLKPNYRILFSAPFGKGKTSFLNLFFEEYKNEYEVFHLYPVNYSIASNEDIFKYIKAELLLQLLTRCDDFQHFEFNNYETLAYYFNNLKQDEFLDSFTPFIKCIPLVGETTYKFLEQIIKLYQSVIKVKQETKIDEKKAALDYIKTLSIKEGSIYEDDLYTQLIRSLIKLIGKTKNKKTVFVIDDLDRLDPEHIFRILNILSAHFDNEHYYSDGDHNKFGFDKIIIACDYHNIYNIYQHKFGNKTDFKGYINKYFSIEPYFYENDKLIKTQLEHLFRNIGNEYVFIILFRLLVLLTEKNQFNIRDLISLNNKRIISNKFFQDEIKLAPNSKHLFFVLIFYLLKIYSSKETLLSAITQCAEISERNHRRHYDDLVNATSLYGLSFNFNSHMHIASTVYYKYKNNELRLQLTEGGSQLSNNNYCQIGMMQKKVSAFQYEDNNFKFNLEDFFDILKINVEEYFKSHGLYGNE